MSMIRSFMHKRTSKQSNSRQRGVGIVEVLIALVLISAGFLAAAQMQMQGMRFSQSAYSNSQAYFMATEIMDRMRANIDGVIAGGYDNAITGGGVLNPNCGTNACNVLELAQQDIYDWSANLHNLTNGVTNFVPVLPSSGTIAASGQIIPQGDGFYQILITWSETEGNSDVAQTLIINFATEVEQS